MMNHNDLIGILIILLFPQFTRILLEMWRSLDILVLHTILHLLQFNYRVISYFILFWRFKHYLTTNFITIIILIIIMNDNSTIVDENYHEASKKHETCYNI